MAVFTFFSLAVLYNNFFNLVTTQILGAVAANLLYKSVLGLCLIISRAARYLPKPALNNIPSLCVCCNFWPQHCLNWPCLRMGRMVRKEARISVVVKSDNCAKVIEPSIYYFLPLSVPLQLIQLQSYKRQRTLYFKRHLGLHNCFITDIFSWHF